MRLIAYLFFAGQCREAFALYRDTFGGELLASMTYGESPMRDELPADSLDQIMHCQLQIDGAMLMGADGPPQDAARGQGTRVNIDVDSVEEAERIYTALSAGGEVLMPLQETFWAHRWAMFNDRFGTPWMVNFIRQSEDCPQDGAAAGAA